MVYYVEDDKNIREIMAQPDIDGALVGEALGAGEVLRAQHVQDVDAERE